MSRAPRLICYAGILGRRECNGKREEEEERRENEDKRIYQLLSHCCDRIPQRCNLREREVNWGSQFQPWQEGTTELMAVGIWQGSSHTLGSPFLSSSLGPKGFITSQTVPPAGDYVFELKSLGGGDRDGSLPNHNKERGNEEETKKEDWVWRKEKEISKKEKSKMK